MTDFYESTLKQLIREGHIATDTRVLVLCGGMYDRDVFATAGFSDVTISNLDERMRGDEFAPFQWSFQDAENLTYADEEFDLCVAHSGLHHCYSPHRALLEMYRVARRGVLVFEPRDGIVTRLGLALGLGQEYETAAVFDNDCAFGGVRNTEIPNYVYRWNEREVRKIIRSFDPTSRQRFRFYYATRIPWRSLMLKRNKLYLAAAAAAAPFLYVLSIVAPRVCNNFAFLILKPRSDDDLQPWIERRSGQAQLRRSWLVDRYAN